MERMKITEEQRSKYKKLFDQHRDQACAISGNAARSLFEKSGLDSGSLYTIWTLSDLDGDGNLDLSEFVVAVHLMTQFCMKGYTIPSSIPPDWTPPDKHRYFKTAAQGDDSKRKPIMTPPSNGGDGSELFGPPLQAPQNMQPAFPNTSPFNSFTPPTSAPSMDAVNGNMLSFGNTEFNGPPPLPSSSGSNSNPNSFGPGDFSMPPAVPSMQPIPQLRRGSSGGRLATGMLDAMSEDLHQEEVRVQQSILSLRQFLHNIQDPWQQRADTLDERRKRLTVCKQQEEQLLSYKKQADEEMEQLRRAIVASEELIGASVERAEKLKLNIGMHTKEVDELRGERDVIDSKLQVALKGVQEADDELMHVQGQLAAVMESVSHNANLIMSLEADIAKLQNKKLGLSMEAEQQSAVIAEACGKEQELTGKKQQLEEEVARLEAQVEAAKQKINRIDSGEEAMTAGDLEKRAEELQAELERAELTLMEAEKKQQQREALVQSNRLFEEARSAFTRFTTTFSAVAPPARTSATPTPPTATFPNNADFGGTSTFDGFTAPQEKKTGGGVDWGFGSGSPGFQGYSGEWDPEFSSPKTGKKDGSFPAPSSTAHDSLPGVQPVSLFATDPASPPKGSAGKGNNITSPISDDGDEWFDP